MVRSQVNRDSSGRSNHKLEDECARIEIDCEGRVCECNPLAELLLRAERCDILGQHISRFIARFSGDDLVHEGLLKPSLVFLCRCGVWFQTLTHAGEALVTQVFVSERLGAEHDRVRLLIREVADGVNLAVNGKVCLN